MQGPKHRRRSSGHDELLNILEKYVELPSSIKYREEFVGKSNPDVLKKHGCMLREIKEGPCKDGSLTQTAGKAAFLKLAKSKETKWHLAQDQVGFATAAGKMLRAMLRDVDQALYKLKDGRKPQTWLEAWL